MMMMIMMVKSPSLLSITSSFQLTDMMDTSETLVKLISTESTECFRVKTELTCDRVSPADRTR